MKQQQQNIPKLDFDHKLLQEINHKLLKSNEKIQIKYYGDFENEDDDELIHYEVFYIYLYVNEKIVSKIELLFSESDYTDLSDAMIISSETNMEYRQMNYNTILRSVIVMLMPSMKIQGEKIDQVVSNAQNYLSVYSLAKLGFIVEEFEGFQQFDLSFYSPFQQTTQKQRVFKQKNLKQYIKKKHEQKQEQTIKEISMVLLKQDYKKASVLAKKILNRICENCLESKKRKQRQTQLQT